MKSKEIVKRKSIRNAEYYDLIDVFDELYSQSLAGTNFCNLMDIHTEFFLFLFLKTYYRIHFRNTSFLDILL